MVSHFTAFGFRFSTYAVSFVVLVLAHTGGFILLSGTYCSYCICSFYVQQHVFKVQVFRGEKGNKFMILWLEIAMGCKQYPFFKIELACDYNLYCSMVSQFFKASTQFLLISYYICYKVVFFFRKGQSLRMIYRPHLSLSCCFIYSISPILFVCVSNILNIHCLK